MPCNCKKNKTSQVKEDLEALRLKAQELEKIIQELKNKTVQPDNQTKPLIFKD